MLKISEKEIHIRMRKFNYVKAVVLADDTILLNMNCDLNYKFKIEDLLNIEEEY